jgi:hypothetical protein
MQNSNFFSPSLLALHLSSFFWLSDLTTSHCNSIALPFAYSIFLLALGPHDKPLQFDRIAIRLLNFLLALGPHDEPLQFDCIAIRLLNFLHPLEGKCIVFDCCFYSVTTPPPISFQTLVRLSVSPRRSTQEESKWPLSPPLSNKGHRGYQPPPFPNRQSAKYHKSTISGW